MLAAIVAATPPNQKGYGFFLAGILVGIGVGGGPTANSALGGEVGIVEVVDAMRWKEEGRGEILRV